MIKISTRRCYTSSNLSLSLQTDMPVKLLHCALRESSTPNYDNTMVKKTIVAPRMPSMSRGMMMMMRDDDGGSWCSYYCCCCCYCCFWLYSSWFPHHHKHQNNSVVLQSHHLVQRQRLVAVLRPRIHSKRSATCQRPVVRLVVVEVVVDEPVP
jgi:hypothetical protein